MFHFKHCYSRYILLHPRRHGIHIVMFANLLEERAGAGAVECHRNVTGTTLISLQRLLFSLHHCDIHELELELEARACAVNALVHGGPGAWSLENGRWRMEHLVTERVRGTRKELRNSQGTRREARRASQGRRRTSTRLLRMNCCKLRYMKILEGIKAVPEKPNLINVTTRTPFMTVSPPPRRCSLCIYIRGAHRVSRRPC